MMNALVHNVAFVHNIALVHSANVGSVKKLAWQL